MGISYSAVKIAVPEAWEIGKDYYALTDLFPPCAHKPDGIAGLWFFNPSMKDLPHLVGSRHMVGPTVFKVTTYFDDALDMVARIEELKDREVDVATRRHLINFHAWAGDDELQLISDFDELNKRDAADEYQLCAPPKKYHHMDSWGGESGRKVG